MNFGPHPNSNAISRCPNKPLIGDELVSYHMLGLARRTSVWLVPKFHPSEQREGCPGHTDELVAFVRGAPHTPYEHATWAVAIKCARNHPFTAPDVRLLNRGVYHPNVCPETGEVPYAKTAWRPNHNLVHIGFDLIRDIMMAPVGVDVVNIECYNTYVSQEAIFKEKVQKNITETAGEAEASRQLLAYLRVPSSIEL